MASRHSDERCRSDALLPALVAVGPYFFNKLIYIEFPDYPVFVAAPKSVGITSTGETGENVVIRRFSRFSVGS